MWPNLFELKAQVGTQRPKALLFAICGDDQYNQTLHEIWEGKVHLLHNSNASLSKLLHN